MVIPWSQNSKLISHSSSTDNTTRTYFRSFFLMQNWLLHCHAKKTVNRKHCSVIFPDMYPYIEAKLHGKILQRLVPLAISSSVAQAVEDSTLDKGAEAEISASHWCNLSRFPLCSDADDMAWAGAALLGTQSTNKDPNNWEEQLFLLRAAKGATSNLKISSTVRLEKLAKFLFNNILLPQLFSMLATLRHYASLAITCSSGAVPLGLPIFHCYSEFAQRYFTCHTALAESVSHSEMYWKALKLKSLPCHLRDIKQKYHLFSSHAPAYTPGRIARYENPLGVCMWLSPCCHPSTAQALPDTSFKLLVVLECPNEWEQSQEEDYPSVPWYWVKCQQYPLQILPTWHRFSTGNWIQGGLWQKRSVQIILTGHWKCNGIFSSGMPFWFRGFSVFLHLKTLKMRKCNMPANHKKCSQSKYKTFLPMSEIEPAPVDRACNDETVRYRWSNF